MTIIPYNPFTNRSTIIKEDEFVGREAEITNLLSHVRNGDSSSIVGPRRIGKSSLLYHLYLTGNRRLEDVDQSKFKFIHIDLQDPAVATVKKFCQHLIQKLGRQLTQAEQQTDELEHLALLSETLHATSSHPLQILLLDEFEKLTEKPERFTDDFFNALRAFANQHKMAIITTSQHTLRELTETQGLTSPLWNLFMVQPVGEFVVSNIVDEATLFLTHFWTGELQPSVEEWKFLNTCKHRQPLRMQIISYWVLENRKLGLSTRKLIKKIDNEWSSYSRNISQRGRKWLWKKGLQIKKIIEWIADLIGKTKLFVL